MAGGGLRRVVFVPCWLVLRAALVSCVWSGTCPSRPPSNDYFCPVGSEYFTFPCLGAGSPIIDSEISCYALAGMAVTIMCSDESLVLYKQNISLGDSTVTYPRVTRSQVGLYSCRSIDNSVVVSRALEIESPTKPIIGLECFYQDVFTLKSLSVVCGVENINYIGGFPIHFNVYCENCSVEMKLEWTNHIGVDLKLQLRRTDNDSVSYVIEQGPKAQVPYAVNAANPTVTILITAATSGAGESLIGFKRSFSNMAGLFAELITPYGQSSMRIGDDVVFRCKYGDYKGLSFIVMELTLNNGTTYAGTCNASICWGGLSLGLTSRYVNAIAQNIGNLTLRSLTKEYNNSQITCSLWFANAIQWKNATTLSFSTPYNHASPFSSNEAVNSSTPQSLSSLCSLRCRALVGGLISGLVCTTVFSLVLILMLYYLKRSSIVKGNSTQENLYQQAESGVEVGLSSAATKSNRSITNTNHRKAKSMSEIITGEKFSFKIQRFYVSCSEEKVGWVTEYLKPLIQKLILGSEVTLHAEDMLAGHPISEERLRLILEADKVLIVCSPGYEGSPWCQYELLQSVAKDPSLTEGRIVSILCEGCSAPPTAISGALSIKSDESMFESKLEQCLSKWTI